MNTRSFSGSRAERDRSAISLGWLAATAALLAAMGLSLEAQAGDVGSAPPAELRLGAAVAEQDLSRQRGLGLEEEDPTGAQDPGAQNDGALPDGAVAATETGLTSGVGSIGVSINSGSVAISNVTLTQSSINQTATFTGGMGGAGGLGSAGSGAGALGSAGNAAVNSAGSTAGF